MTRVSRIAAESVRETLTEALPDAGRVGLVGDDATAVWLAQRGHTVVRLVSPSDAPDARRAADRAGVADRVRVVVGTAERPPIRAETLDAVCWLGDGPSAYPSGSRRRDAVAAVVELVPEQGRIVIAGLGRIGALRLALGRDPSGVADSATGLFDDGRFDADRLDTDVFVHDTDVSESGTDTATQEMGTAGGGEESRDETGAADQLSTRLPFHGYRLQEFESELVNEDLVVERVIGLDGLLIGTDHASEGLSTDAVSALERVTRRAGRERSVADGSFRLLAVCRRKRDRSLDTEPTVIS